MNKIDEIKQALAAATQGPWAIYKTTVGKCEETLIGTEYDHPQLKAPDNIVGHACGLGGEFVYIRDNDATLIANAPEYIAYLLEENERLSKELEEARKIKFPRQANGEGGWTIDYDFLDRLDTRVYKVSYYSADLEDLETMLLALEEVLGQEGEGNQRTIEVTLTNEGYKEHELKFEEQGEIQMENKLTLWYNIEKRESIVAAVKENVKKRYGFSDGEFVSIGGGFKFLFDDETNGEIAITFIEENGNLKLTLEGSWPWEVIEVYNHCLPWVSAE